MIQLNATSYIDEILLYKTEKDLYSLLEQLKPDIRILGSDYRGKAATGQNFSQVMYHERSHTWSSSELRARIDGN